MKKIALVILVHMQIYSMQKVEEDTHHELQEAIKKSDDEKVSELIKRIKHQPKHTRSKLVHEPKHTEQSKLLEQEHTIQSSSAPKKVDLKQLQELAKKLLTQQEEASKTLNNRYVYQRILISAGTIVSSWIPLGICTYNGVTSGGWPSGDMVFGSITAGVAGTYHGIDQLWLGLCNEDAKTKYNKHREIVSQLADASKEETGSNESV